jgi:hypothetical protein
LGKVGGLLVMRGETSYNGELFRALWKDKRMSLWSTDDRTASLSVLLFN